ncbi:RICIN domain-containing protein [Antrihabitans sp. YC2-6]|uniref:RICIN domain-containing protein n=1 Tax=Antrihabitans sp. YC2-6 TaxID=2799498 RepID=UPI0018F53112|nr:RICIN domain-containing protein [Antrihabitans sp. YC2-6]
MTPRTAGKISRHTAERITALFFLAIFALTAMLFAPGSAHAAIPPDVVTIQQLSSGRYLDAWNDGSHDNGVVTRPNQGDPSQQWRITWDESGTSTGTIQQMSNGLYLDAHEISDRDYQTVTRPEQNNATQMWQVSSVGNGLYTITQASSGRLLDAHEYAEKDFGCVTRPGQDNDTQLWRVVVIGH